MEDLVLFPFADVWWVYAAFVALVVAMLGLDLGLLNRKDHVIRPREAVIWSAIWVTVALIFGAGLTWWSAGHFAGDPRLMAVEGFDPQAAARQVGVQFLTGFLLEKALAVDNLFVIAVIFTALGIPAARQHRVLFLGILGAIVFRGVFVALGAWLFAMHWVVVLGGVFLILTGAKLLLSKEDKPTRPEERLVYRLLARVLPITPKLHEDRWVVRTAGRLHATPLLVALVLVEATDLLFALDSVPAVFAVTREPLIVFTSNILAILGLRSLYFLLAGMMDKFWLLPYALGSILVFVGSKMAFVEHLLHGKVPVGVSLGVIAGLLVGAIVGSLMWPRAAHAAANEA